MSFPQGKKASNQTTTEAQNASLGQRGAIRSKGQLHNGLRCFFSPYPSDWVQSTRKWLICPFQKAQMAANETRKRYDYSLKRALRKWLLCPFPMSDDFFFFSKRNGHEAQRNRGAKRSNEIDSENGYGK